MMARKQAPMAAGLAVLAVLLAAGIIALPVFKTVQLRDEMAAARVTLATLERSIKDGSGLTGVTVTDLLIRGGTIGRASADLQQRLNDAAKGAGLTIRSIQALTPKQDGELMQVSAEATLQASAPALRQILHGIETGLPIMIVDELSVRTLTAAAGAAPASAVLEASLKVRAFATKSEAPSP